MESGFHSEQWFELDRLFDAPERLAPFVSELARRLAPHRPDAICGPMTGGAKLAEWVARELGVLYVFTERHAPRDPAPGFFPVGYRVPAVQRDLVRGRSVALVDDAISAGSAVRGSHADLLACGAQPVALGALFVFGDAAARYAVEHRLALEAMVRTSFNLWTPQDCPLCKAGVALEVVSDATPSTNV